MPALDFTPPSLALSDFYRANSTREKGNSYCLYPERTFLHLVSGGWPWRKPGTGETGLDRKVVVSIPRPTNQETGELTYFSEFFCPPRVKLVTGMPLRVEVVERQKGEDPSVEVYITPEDAAQYGYVETVAKKIDVVCYSAAALLENGGARSSDAEWEVVTLLCAEHETEPMTPLTMARNQLEKPGGTKPETPYDSDTWAQAVWAHANRGVKVRRPRQ